MKFIGRKYHPMLQRAAMVFIVCVAAFGQQRLVAIGGGSRPPDAMLFLLVPYGLASWAIEYFFIKSLLVKKQKITNLSNR